MYYCVKAVEKDKSEENCQVNRQSMFLEKPMNVFDVSFELLHTGVACLTGESLAVCMCLYLCHWPVSQQI